MGARTYWEIRTRENSPSIYLYSHWGADSKWEDTASALKATEPRWGDTTYSARIFISQIIGNLWDSETGFGITAEPAGSMPFDEESFSVVVDFSNNTIRVSDLEYSFEEFLASADNTESILESIYG